MKRALRLEDSEAADEDANSDRKLDSVDYRTSIDCIAVVRKETVDTELARCTAFDRQIAVVQTETDRMAIENTVVVDMFADRMAVENNENYTPVR